MTFIFDFNIPVISWCLTGAGALLILPLILIYLRPVWRVSNHLRMQHRHSPDATPDIPVSVIVYAADQAEALERLLPQILNQQYGAPFEVVVVNDGESDATAAVVERLRTSHPDIYLTFTPDGARNLSRKKLALTVGIKAARYPVVVTTTAAADIQSDTWLAHMVAPFAQNPATELVIGYGDLDWAQDNGAGRRSRCFNGVADAVAWLGAARAGRPYRGSELNLAYTRQAFFDHRGFSHSLNLKNGDDDIFVNELSHPGNSVLVLHPDAIVRRTTYNTARAYRTLTQRYTFTGTYLPRWRRRRIAAGAFLLVAIAGLCIAGTVTAWPNLMVAAAALLVLLGAFIPSVIIWRRAIRELSGRNMLLTLPVLMLTRPWVNLARWIKMRRHRRRNFTWV